MFKENSLFNRIWYRIFKRKLIYKKGVLWTRDEKIQYQCTGCKKQHWDMPNTNGEKYQWSWDDKISCKLQPEINDDNIITYGWIIEMKGKTYDWQKWEIHWNKRVYKSKEVALDAINQISTTSLCSGYDLRIRPLYDINNQHIRNVKISRLLKSKKEK